MYDDDDDDQYDGDQSVSGPGELAGGFTEWPSLRQPRGHWGATLKRNQAKAAHVGGPTNVEGQDELRWGDRRNRTIIVPNGTVGLVGLTPSFEQVVQLRRPARVWSLLYSIDWVNPLQSPLVAGEDILAFFSVYLGVGSSRIRIARDLAISGPTVPPIFTEFGIEVSTTDANLPAAEIVISVNAAVNCPVAAVGNRTFNLVLSAQASPVSR